MNETQRRRRPPFDAIRDALVAIAIAACGVAVFGGDVVISQNPAAGVLLVLAGALLFLAAVAGIRRGLRTARGRRD